MKIYSVNLSAGRQTFVNAEGWMRNDTDFQFFCNGTEVARYDVQTVLKIEDCTRGAPCASEYEAQKAA